MLKPSHSECPAALGFSMPAEWLPHTATWIAWPHNEEDWPGKFAPIPWIYADIARLISKDEKVHILAQSEEAEAEIREILEQTDVRMENVKIFQLPTDRVWTRDSGPIFITKKTADGIEGAITNWHFNAWAKYDNWTLDDKVPDFVAEQLKVKQFKPMIGSPAKQFVLEGGSIDVNGAGLLLTTEECLLSEIQQRNPGLSREQIEQVMADYLGIKKVLWLKDGIVGDDTHGHIDDLARFTDENTIAIVQEDDPSDANYELLKENMSILKEMRNLNNEPFRIVKLPMPQPVIFDGERLPASYANFILTNNQVLVPIFNDPNDLEALNTLQNLFPTRKVTGVYARDLIWGLGTLHCMTQQQPFFHN